jgi:predicted SnoaL-like aldol condensation-catalyzing enzyme
MSETLTAGSVAAAHAEYMIGTGDALVGMMADDFYDHVSGRTGREIWAVVTRWLDESFSHRTCEVLAALADGDRIVIWFVAGGVHVGSGFPWLRGRPPSGRKVTWAQVHMFRVADGLLREHWAVRDDLRRSRRSTRRTSRDRPGGVLRAGSTSTTGSSCSR